MAEKVGSVLTVEPAIWQSESEYNTRVIQRQWQWYRNGSAISGATGASYVLVNADQGANITVTETAGFIQEDTNWNDIRTWPTGKSAASTSSAVAADSSAVDAKLVYANNFNYLGGFAIPTAGFSPNRLPGFSGGSLTVKKNGVSASTLLVTASGELAAAEISIPTSLSSTFTSYAALPIASLIYPASPSTELPKLPYALNIGNIGVDPTNGVVPFGAYANNGAAKIYFSIVDYYTYSNFQLNFRRPIALSDTNQANLEGPFFFDGVSPRWSSGWYCGIPSTPVLNKNGVSTNYQTALGGDILSSLCGIAILSTASNGPTVTVSSDSAITTALGRVQSGTARGGTLNSIQLAASATDVTVGDGLFCSSAAYVGEGVYVTAFDNVNKIATVAPSGTGSNAFATAPTSLSTYNIVPKVAAKALVGYGVNYNKNLEPYGNLPGQNRRFYSIWAQCSLYRGMCIPDGTRSLLFFSLSEDGFSIYGPFNEPRAESWLYTLGAQGTGPHHATVQYKVTAFDLDDLADVASGARNYNDVKPYAVFSINFPGFSEPLNENQRIGAAAYDSSTKTLYLTHQLVGTNVDYITGCAMIHAFQITNAVIV